MPTRSQPHGKFVYNTGLYNDTPADLRTFKDEVDAMGTVDGIGSTSTDGFILENTTPAAVGAQQWSPRLRWTGQGWKTNATAGSQEVDFIAELVPVQGAANPSSYLSFKSQVNAAGYNDVMAMTSGGNLGIGTVTPLFKTSVVGNANSMTELQVSNSTAGTAAAAGIRLDADAGGGSVRAVSSAFTPAGDMLADSFQIRSFSTASGGLQLVAGGANPIRLWTNSVERLTLDSAGLINVPGLTASKVVFTDGSKNLTSTGTVGVAQGGTGTTTAFTAGSVIFAGASGVYSQDNANLFWDDSTNQLMIGTTTPILAAALLSVKKDQNANTAIYIQNSTAGTSARASFGVMKSTTGVYIDALSSLWTTSGIYVQNSANLSCDMPAGLYVGTAAAADLVLYSNSTARLKALSAGTLQIQSASQLSTASYVSQLTGWAVTYAGDGDFRYLYADQLHAKSFIADLEQALAGGQIISKSVAEVAIAFTLPAAAGAGTLTVKDLPSAIGMAVFVSGDIVRLRQFTRSGGALTIADAWGVVTSYTDLGNGTQTWTFTRSSGGREGTASGTIAKNTLALDYGTTGNGFHEVNAVDGAYGINSPYSQIVTWATHPQNGQVVRTRVGNLKGLTGTTEYGLFAGNGSIADVSKFIRITDVNFEIHNVGLNIFDSTTKVIELNQAGPYFALGNPMPTSFLQASTEGIWMGKVSSDYCMRVGKTDAGGALTAGFKWDGATDTLTVIGTVTATAGAIGGWSITSTDIRNSGATVMLRGAGNLAFGSTPPTAANSGTGLFLDSTGMYGLASSVVQAKFDAATGAIVAGGSLIKMDSLGLSIAVDASPYVSASSLKFFNSTDRVADIYASGTAATSSQIVMSTRNDTSNTIILSAETTTALRAAVTLTWNEGTGQGGFLVSGVTRAAIAGGGVATFSGLIVGGSGVPNAMLDVRGNTIIVGGLDIQTTTNTLRVPRMTTTQKNALTAVNGDIIYDSTLNKFQGRENGAWVSFI